MRIEAGSRALVDSKKTDPISIVDLTGEYRITKNIDVYMKVLNVLDYQGIVAARPAGVRPTMPRAVLAGIRFSF
jgi:outer membrane receptor protein involved in Fe transport